jgi:energy-coupling factor transporter ATP-binding protein EcfA2
MNVEARFEHLPARVAVREITIENFRGITQMSLSFVGPRDEATDLVVLAGPNGSGKTSVIEACLIAAQHGSLIRSPERASAIQQDYRINATLETRHGRVYTEHVPGSGRYWKDIDHPSRTRQLEPDDAPCAYFSSWRAPRFMGALPITAGKRGKRPTEREENRLWIVKQYLINAKAHEALSSGSPRSDAILRYQELVGRLEYVWALFHPGSQQRFAVEPVGEDPDDGFDVFLIGPDGRRVSLDDLSSGEIELINFAGWTLVTKFDGGIICIDEPELHLDPQWHSLLVRALRELQPRAQFIVATHSPAVYDAAFSFQRHLLVPAGDARASAWSPHDRAATNR